MRKTLPIPVRREVRRRAQDRCENCGKPAEHTDLTRMTRLGLEFHHINGQVGGENDLPANIGLLCKACHVAQGGHGRPEGQIYTRVRSLRLGEDDLRRIQRLQEQWGLAREMDAVREALRRQAETEGIP